MKKKIIVAILIILMMLANAYINETQAFTGEIDPENYVTLPYSILIKNGIGTGTINLLSSASDYTIFYEKVDITKQDLENIEAKYNSANSYLENENKKLEQKRNDLQTVQEEYTNALEETPQDETKVNLAKEKYEKAVEEYNDYFKNINTEYKKLCDEYLNMVPTYSGNWKQTTNSTDNVQIDFSNASGEVYFVLWVKISNGSNTYYDFKAYTSEVNTNNGSTDTDGNAESGNINFSLKKDGNSNAMVEISGVENNEEHMYYLTITSNSDKPDVNSDDLDMINLYYDNTSKTFKSNEVYKIAGYVEQNKDLYASLIEYDSSTYDVIKYGVKLERYSEPLYSDAFYSTYMSKDSDQIIMNFTHSIQNNRKIKIKIGKITDISILKKIKDQNSSGFSDLLSFAKSSNGLYEQTLETLPKESYNIRYDTDDETDKVIKINGMENEAYYYLYIQTDSENGKFISNEAITLAQGNVYEDGNWYLFFYGDADFKWADFGNVSVGGDKTTAPSGRLPQTGAFSYITVITVALAIVGAISYRNYKKNNF